MTYSFILYRSSLAPPVESSSGAPPWLSSTLVTVIFSLINKHKPRPSCRSMWGGVLVMALYQKDGRTERCISATHAGTGLKTRCWGPGELDRVRPSPSRLASSIPREFRIHVWASEMILVAEANSSRCDQVRHFNSPLPPAHLRALTEMLLRE